MIVNRDLTVAQSMARAIRDAGHEVTSPWVLGPIESHNPRAVNVFERDMRGAEECDAIVADVSSPSIGVGMEIMAAYKAGRKVIVVAKGGATVSRMLQHMEGKKTVEFEDGAELYEKLKDVLARLGDARRGAGNQK
jgi:nucleoside 2-deoxyribosyltransferase